MSNSKTFFDTKSSQPVYFVLDKVGRVEVNKVRDCVLEMGYMSEKKILNIAKGTTGPSVESIFSV